MDPNETLKQIENSNLHTEERELSVALNKWLSSGGFQPDWNKYPHGTKLYKMHCNMLKSPNHIKSYAEAFEKAGKAGFEKVLQEALVRLDKPDTMHVDAICKTLYDVSQDKPLCIPLEYSIARSRYRTWYINNIGGEPVLEHSPEKPKSEVLSPGVDQIPFEGIEAIGAIFAEGEKKYGINNWKKQPDNDDYNRERTRHAIRHLMLWANGDRSEAHLAKVAWFCVTTIWREKHGRNQK